MAWNLEVTSIEEPKNAHHVVHVVFITDKHRRFQPIVREIFAGLSIQLFHTNNDWKHLCFWSESFHSICDARDVIFIFFFAWRSVVKINRFVMLFRMFAPKIFFETFLNLGETGQQNG